MTEEFLEFYHQILDEKKISSAVADVVSARIRAIPRLAKDMYQAQYFALKEKFSLFSEYSSTEENRIIINKLDQLPQALKELEDDRELEHTIKAHEAQERYYKSQIRKKILYDGNNDEYDMLPTIEDSFIPQSYKSIVFRTDGKNRTLLGPDETWKAVEEKDDLITCIGQTVGASPFDRKPLIILGDPGGGKSTLSKMLAANILSLQYYVIIVRLREVNAKDSIFVQIEQQVERDIDERVEWVDIRKCAEETEIPLLIIFDGYDELLRAGGKEYTGFIKSVYEFQQKQEELYNILIRTVITSRRNLIDLAEIPNNSAIICLQEFSEGKVNEWTEIWNRHNATHYSERGTQPFEVRPRYSELTKQPLLLSMLALYDYDDNALAQEFELNSADVYRNLLENYVKRELRNKKLTTAVWGDNRSEIMHGFLRVAAMGMLNRGQLYLTKEQFEQDLHFYRSENPAEKTNQFDDGIKVFGSFFFVNTSKVKENADSASIDKYTYEFLHTTFGEFLAADYIWKRFAPVVAEYLASGQVSDELKYTLYKCIVFTCLSEKPTLLNMITEISGDFTVDQLSDYLTSELKNVISGNLILQISRWLEVADIPYERITLLCYAALYVANLISICTFANKECYAKLSSKEWATLIQFLRTGLCEEDLEIFAYLLNITQFEEGYRIQRQKLSLKIVSSMSGIPRSERLHVTNHFLIDEVNLAFTGTVYADYLVEPYIEKHGLELKSELYYLMMVKRMYPSNDEMGTLMKAQNACFDEEKYDILIALYSFVKQDFESGVKYKKQLKSLFLEGMRRFESISEEALNDRYNKKTIKKAFLELLNLSQIVKINYTIYKSVMELSRKLYIGSRYGRFAVISFVANKISVVPSFYRNKEIEMALAAIYYYIRPGNHVAKRTADLSIRLMGKMFEGFSPNRGPSQEGGIYDFADRIIGDILVSCRSLNYISKEANRIILAYLTQLYFKSNSAYNWLIERLSLNQSYLFMLKEWLDTLSDYPARTVFVLWKTVSYLKTINICIDQKVLSKAMSDYSKINVSDEAIANEAQKAVRQPSEGEESQNL